MGKAIACAPRKPNGGDDCLEVCDTWSGDRGASLDRPPYESVPNAIRKLSWHYSGTLLAPFANAPGTILGALLAPYWNALAGLDSLRLGEPEKSIRETEIP